MTDIRLLMLYVGTVEVSSWTSLSAGAFAVASWTLIAVGAQSQLGLCSPLAQSHGFTLDFSLRLRSCTVSSWTLI